MISIHDILKKIKQKIRFLNNLIKQNERKIYLFLHYIQLFERFKTFLQILRERYFKIFSLTFKKC